MAKRFVWLRSIKKSYAEQGKIFFQCLNYKNEPRATKEKIDRLCREVGGEYEKALKEYLTDNADMQYISTRYYLSVATLDRLRKAFYEKW